MSITQRNYSEKRNFIRMKVNTGITLASADGEIQGICKDISGSGLLVETTEAIAVGVTLLAHINSQSESRPPFRATCETTRVLTNDNGTFLVGLTVKAIHD